MTNHIIKLVQNWTWISLVFFLPITSLPIIVSITGSNSVGALSGLFLAVFVLIWLIPYLLKGGKISAQSVPIIGFFLLAVIATVLASFRSVPLYKEIDFVRSEVTSLITLIIGFLFYLIPATWINNDTKLESTLRWINFGGMMLISISILQIAYWYVFGGYPEWLRNFHNVYSIAPLIRQRPSGMTLEPSWLAHQLNLLYIPLWIATTIKRFTVFRRKIGPLTIENLLLILAVGILFLTLSRVGLIAFSLVVFYLMLRAGIGIFPKILQYLSSKLKVDKKTNSKPGRIHVVLGYFLISILFVILLLSLGYGLSQVDRRMADVFVFSPSSEDGFIKYAERLNFGSRVIYWGVGWQLFDDYTWLGVGLGNTGFYFTDYVSSYGWKLMEVREILYRMDFLPNLKSLWVRLLAETGIIGFILFTAWLYVLWQASRALLDKPRAMYAAIGLAGQIAMVALLAEGFSIDSFALPYLWFTMGLVTASSALGYEKLRITGS